MHPTKDQFDCQPDDESAKRGQQAASSNMHSPQVVNQIAASHEYGLVEDIVKGLQTKPYLICAEPYMGKSTILAGVASAMSDMGVRVRHVDCRHMLSEEATRMFADAARWANRMRRTGERAFFACDDLPASDESDSYEQVRLCRRILSSGCMVMITMLPEAESFVELLGEAVTYWSSDLRFPCSDKRVPIDVQRRFGAPIPALADVLVRLSDYDDTAIICHPSYAEAYAKVVEACVRPHMIEDERRLRCALLLLGSGTLDDVESVCGRVDAGLWRDLARDVPLLGVDAARDTFACVASCINDALSVIFATLQAIVDPWPELVYAASCFLADKGDYKRASIVSLMCSSDELRCEVTFAWGAEFVNVGEVSAVRDALDDVEGNQDLVTVDYYPTKRFVASLAGDAREHAKGLSAQTPAAVRASSRQETHAAMAQFCRAVARGEEQQDEVPDADEVPDELSKALAIHASFLRSLSAGCVEASYECLLDGRMRDGEPTVASSILTMDYVLCSLMMGIVPSAADMVDLARAGVLFEQGGLGWLVTMREAVVPLGCMLMGRRAPKFSLDDAIRRSGLRGDNLFRGMLLLAAGVKDLREGIYTRAHVRVQQAREAFECPGGEALVKTSRLVDIAIRSHLGEKVKRSEILSCRGATTSIDKVVAVVAHSLSHTSERRTPGLSKARLSACPRDVLWLVNVLSGDCGDYSVRFRESMPAKWKDAIVRATRDVDELLDRGEERRDAQALLRDGDLADKGGLGGGRARDGRIDVTMLGGLEVRVGGVALRTSSFERRRAKALLALLVAVPGHSIKRFVAMESVWPEYDYEAANKCIYSATSVLRSEVGSAVGQKKTPLVIVSNKVEGTISLDLGSVSCDIDVFEEKAHKLLDSEGDDRAVVSLCREIEDLYRGNLFVPSADGAGIIEARAQVLRDLYADALVMGSVSASNLGMKMLACRFAQKAHAADAIREDAMRVLVVSLCAVGRYVEAQASYDDYVSQMIGLSRKPPSRQLREIVDKYVRRKVEGDKERRGDKVGRVVGTSRTSVSIVESKQQGSPGQMTLDFGMIA